MKFNMKLLYGGYPQDGAVPLCRLFIRFRPLRMNRPLHQIHQRLRGRDFRLINCLQYAKIATNIGLEDIGDLKADLLQAITNRKGDE